MRQFFRSVVWVLLLGTGLTSLAAQAAVKVGDSAPLFQLKTQENQTFDLNSRKGHWTILYFYPKADTPGCTKQACTYRDSLSKIKELKAEVFGISADDVSAIAAFHTKHKLNFTLLADPQASTTEAYGAKMPLVKMAKRWTFVIDPNLIVRRIDAGVDPVADAGKMAEFLKTAQQAPAVPQP